jgi:uncharacterized protein YkwD
MDIRTWQEADRLELPEPGFEEDPAFHGASAPGEPLVTAFGAAGSGYAAADVIALSPPEQSRGPRSAAHSARHRSGRSPFSPLRPAPIAIGSLSTAAIAAFAFVGPGILHGGDAASTTPLLDGMPQRMAPLNPGAEPVAPGGAAAHSGAAASPSSPGTPTSIATGAANGPVTSASTPGGDSGAPGSSSPGSPGGPGHPGGQTGPTGPGPTPPTSPPGPVHSTPAPPARTPGPPSGPPTTQPTPPVTPPWGPVTPTPPSPPSGPPTTPPTTPPTSTPPAPTFNSAAAVAAALTEIDTARTSSGAGQLTVDPVLVQAASKHTSDMVRTRRFSHTGSDGSNPYSRAQALGCWTLSKELIARGRPGDDVVGALLRDWQANMALMSSANRSIGISAQQDPTTGDVYWTIELAWL